MGTYMKFMLDRVLCTRVMCESGFGFESGFRALSAGFVSELPEFEFEKLGFPHRCSIRSTVLPLEKVIW